MSISNIKKYIDTPVMDCNGTANVTISFDAASSLSQEPSDIILIMDRSGSMAGEKMSSSKAAADQLIQMIAVASGGNKNMISGGSRMGIVSFASEATEDVQLTEDTVLLSDAVNALTSGDLTNHRAAFEAAERMIPQDRSRRRIVVMFTDGATTKGDDPAPVAERMKADGIEIYCIGLLADPAFLNMWASDPSSDHVAYTEDPAELDKVFSSVAGGIIIAGARDISINEKVYKDFKILGVTSVTEGDVQITGPQSLTWSVDTAGISPDPETYMLSFDIMHIGNSDGIRQVNRSLTYHDRAGNQPVFPEPSVEIRCASPVYPESCPAATSFAIGKCRDAGVIEAPAVNMQSLGRIVQVNATIQNVCPGKRVAAAIILTEEDIDGMEYPRGSKTVIIPAQSGQRCKDVIIRCVQFVVPESLDVSGRPDSICNARKFNVQVMANYIDTDYVCCAAEPVII